MLTSFFGKSHPINFIVLAFLLLVGYIFGGIAGTETFLTLPSLLQYVFYFIVLFFSLLLLDFIVKKNKLTLSNSYAIVVFTCFLVMFPAIFTSHDIIIAHLFIILAFRRMLSLNNDLNSEKKILDASIWLTVASFFYFWSLLFFIALFIAILRGTAANYKKILIPFAGFFATFILATTYHFLINDSFAWFFKWFTPTSFNFSAYHSGKILLPVSFLCALLIWTAVDRITQLGAISRKENPNTILLLVLAAISIFVSLLSPVKNGAEAVFVFFPTAIIASKYIERISEIWFKELLLWMLLLLPVALLIFYK